MLCVFFHRLIEYWKRRSNSFLCPKTSSLSTVALPTLTTMAMLLCLRKSMYLIVREGRRISPLPPPWKWFCSRKLSHNCLLTHFSHNCQFLQHWSIQTSGLERMLQYHISERVCKSMHGRDVLYSFSIYRAIQTLRCLHCGQLLRSSFRNAASWLSCSYDQWDMPSNSMWDIQP